MLIGIRPPYVISSLAAKAPPSLKEFYLGLNEAGAHRSYHDVKRYRRRKRWLS